MLLTVCMCPLVLYGFRAVSHRIPDHYLEQIDGNDE